MYTTQQIDFIREYGNKELTFGCIIGKGDYILTKWFTCHDNSCVYIVGENRNGNIEFCGQFSDKEIDIIGHNVELHHVFAKLRSRGFTVDVSTRTEKVIAMRIYYGSKYRSYKDIDCDLCLSPMEQPILIEELLKLKQ